MSQLPQEVVEEEIKRKRKMAKLEWVYYVRLKDPSENDVPQEGPENNMIHQDH